MKKAIAAIAAAILCVSAAPGFNTLHSDAIPPVQYRGLGEAKIRFVPKDEIEDYCQRNPDAPKGSRVIACTKFGAWGNTIIFPDPCVNAELEYVARILCHELAHSRGKWPSNHPSGIVIPPEQ